MKIFASLLTTGEVPEDWRGANYVPLFKRGSRWNPGIYRPVSLITIREDILGLDILPFVMEDVKQHGRSCLSNMITFFVEVMKVIDKGRVVNGFWEGI